MKTRIALAALVAAIALAYPAQATLTTTCSKQSYTGNGSTTVFTFPCKFLANTDLVVQVAGVTKTYGVDYSVTGAGGSSGAVTFTVAPATSASVVISRLLPFTQKTSLGQSRTFDPRVIETALDRETMLAQQLNDGNLLGSIFGIGDNSLVTATGANTPRALAAWLADATNVRAFGCAGNGTTDDTTCITNAIAALPASGGILYFPPGGNYKVSDQFTITRPGTQVIGYGAKITQTGVLKRGITATAARVKIEGLWVYNTRGTVEWADNPAGSTNAIGIVLDTGCDGCKVVNCTVEGFGWSGIRVYQSKRVLIQGNEVIGIGATKPLVAHNNNNLGIELYLSGAGYPGTRVIANNVHDLAQGIYMGFDWQDVVIANNTIRDIQGQHGMYLGGGVNIIVSGNAVTTTGENCIKQQISSDTTLNSENSTFIGNAVSGCGAAGIIFLPAQGGLTPRFKNIAVVSNVVRNPAATGIDIDQADYYNVASNSVEGAGTFAIELRSNNGSGRVGGNVLTSSQQTAIYAQARSTADLGVLENNFIIDPAQSGTGTSDVRAGMYLSTGEWIARDNVMTATNPTPVGFSFNINGSAIATLQRNRTIANKNNVTSGTVVIDGRTAIGAPGGGTLTPNAQTTNLFVITASAAAAAWTNGAPLNPTSDAVLTETVRNTSAGALGTLTWDPIYKMAAWTQPGAGTSRSITFRFDGTNWVEISRTPADVPN